MKIYKITLHISLRRDILDPAGRAVEQSLNSLSFSAQNVRIGKTITFSLQSADPKQASMLAQEMAEKLLVNPVMEDFTITIDDTKE